MKKLIPLLIIPLIFFPLFFPLKTIAIEIVDGDLIRATNTLDVYIVKIVDPSSSSGQVKKFKRLILSPEIFNKYGHLKWENIKDISQTILDEYKVSDLVRAVGDEKVYKLYPDADTGTKRWVKTADDFLDLGYDWDAIYTINSFERDYYIPGEDLIALKPPSKEEGSAEQEPAVPVRNPITINVPADYSTIQAAINAAIDNDTISIKWGIYNENIIINKNIKIIGESLSAVIDGQGNGPAITIINANDFTIQRFTIKSKDEKAIYCSGESQSKGIIRNTILKDSGWGIFADGNCNLTILNNLIYNNKDSGKIGAVGVLVKNNFSYNITAEVRNNTIDGNYHGIWIENANLKVINNIITNNYGLGNSSGIYHIGTGISNNTFNDVWQNGFNFKENAKAGDNTLLLDPFYVEIGQRNYKLKTGTTDYSSCLDAGNPEHIYDDAVYSSNTNRNDMGAYGGPENSGW